MTSQRFNADARRVVVMAQRRSTTYVDVGDLRWAAETVMSKGTYVDSIPPFTVDAKRVLERALRLSVEAGDGEIEPKHILAAAQAFLEEA